jgi:hypothetical protein
VRFRLFIALCVALPTQGNAAEPIHLAPSTPWIVDYAEDSCRLMRRFGAGSDVTTLSIESESPELADMLVIGRPLEIRRGTVSVKFLPPRSKPMTGEVDQTVKTEVPTVLVNAVVLGTNAYAAKQWKQLAAMRSRRNADPDKLRAEIEVEGLSERYAYAANTTGIEIGARRPVILDTGSLEAAIRRFDQCNRDSLRDWGLDPDVEDRIILRARADVTRWFVADDYPPEMLARARESVVKVRVLVDATGRVTKCTSISHFQGPEFNRITCAKFMERVHFKPAELADGTKVPDYYVNRVFFRIAY